MPQIGRNEFFKKKKSCGISNTASPLFQTRHLGQLYLVIDQSREPIETRHPELFKNSLFLLKNESLIPFHACPSVNIPYSIELVLYIPMFCKNAYIMIIVSWTIRCGIDFSKLLFINSFSILSLNIVRSNHYQIQITKKNINKFHMSYKFYVIICKFSISFNHAYMCYEFYI